MLTLLAMSTLLLSAHAEERTVSLTVTDPTGVVTELSGPLPFEDSATLAMGKASQQLVVRATEDGDGISVRGELHERKGSKDKIVRIAFIDIAEEGVTKGERLAWQAPRGATVPDGLDPLTLTWRLTASWSAPATEAEAPEDAETGAETPEEVEAPEEAASEAEAPAE